MFLSKSMAIYSFDTDLNFVKKIGLLWSKLDIGLGSPRLYNDEPVSLPYVKYVASKLK